MPRIKVDFKTVRYSLVEGTHYFYDAISPSTIQFLLSGEWESWDVGWVKYKAQDPDIRRIAKEAETRLIKDPDSTYLPWPSQSPLDSPSSLVNAHVPSQSPPGSPSSLVNGHAPSQPAAASTPSPSIPDQPAAASTPSPSIPDLVPLSPSPDYAPPAPCFDPVPTQEHTSSYLPAPVIPYISPYAYQAPNIPPFGHQSPNFFMPTQLPPAISAPVQAIPINEASARTYVQPPEHTQYAWPPPGPSIQPAASTGVVLSRRREIKILLSIDGDGIRGLSALLVIESLLHAICVEVGQRLEPHQIFDMTTGCSLGGVIAILLCRLRMQTHRAREAYMRISRQVYLNKRDHFLSQDPHNYAYKPNIDGMALEAEIKTIVQQELGNQNELLRDIREDSGNMFVVSTHFDIGSNKAVLLRSYDSARKAGPILDTNMTVWQAMKATSVAPQYMPPTAGFLSRMIIEPGLVDHGTAKNGPVNDVFYECRKLSGYGNDRMIVVSIGTGLGFGRDNEVVKMVHALAHRSAEARACGVNFERANRLLLESGVVKYFRFNVPLEGVALEEWCQEDLIMQKTSAYLARPDIARRFYRCVDTIAQLLREPVDQ